MKALDLQGVIRDKLVNTTISDRAASLPTGPGQLAVCGAWAERLVGFKPRYAATKIGFVYAASVIDTYARRILG